MSHGCLAELMITFPPHTEFHMQKPIARINKGSRQYAVCGLPAGHDGPHESSGLPGYCWPNTDERRQTVERTTMWRRP